MAISACFTTRNQTYRKRNAKIVATLGPASADRATIQALLEAGADVFRLNFSHGAAMKTTGSVWTPSVPSSAMPRARLVSACA